MARDGAGMTGCGQGIDLCKIRSSEFMQQVIGSEWRGLGRASHGYKSCFWVETGWRRSEMEAERPEREMVPEREDGTQLRAAAARVGRSCLIRYHVAVKPRALDSGWVHPGHTLRTATGSPRSRLLGCGPGTRGSPFFGALQGSHK